MLPGDLVRFVPAPGRPNLVGGPSGYVIFPEPATPWVGAGITQVGDLGLVIGFRDVAGVRWLRVVLPTGATGWVISTCVEFVSRSREICPRPG